MQNPNPQRHPWPHSFRATPYFEDLPAVALESFRISQSLCQCRDRFHALWSYVRIARGSSVVDSGNRALQPEIAKFAAGGRKRIAIAGAADTGLLALVARATAGRAAGIVVIDRCAIPLALCNDFARRWSLPVETVHRDLADFDVEANFDVVFAHSVLAFIDADRRAGVLRRLNRSLSRDGHLMIKFNTAQRRAGADPPAYQYTDRVLKALEDEGVPLPEPRSNFRSRLYVYEQSQSARTVAFQSFRDVEALLDAAGFEIVERKLVDNGRSAPFGYHESLARQGFFVVARPVNFPAPAG